jgi:hypothetical protein
VNKRKPKHTLHTARELARILLALWNERTASSSSPNAIEYSSPLSFACTTRQRAQPSAFLYKRTCSVSRYQIGAAADICRPPEAHLPDWVKNNQNPEIIVFGTARLRVQPYSSTMTTEFPAPHGPMQDQALFGYDSLCGLQEQKIPAGYFCATSIHAIRRQLGKKGRRVLHRSASGPNASLKPPFHTPPPLFPPPGNYSVQATSPTPRLSTA